MKSKKITITIAAILAMALSLGASSVLAETSTANVSFTAGDLEFGNETDSTLAGMDITFGPNPVPVIAVDYAANEESRSIRILDARTGGGKWKLTVGLSIFESVPALNTDEFIGTIMLLNAMPDADNDDTFSPGDLNEDIVVSNSGSVTVVDTANRLNMGRYDISWLKDDIRLVIDDDEAKNITEPVDFKATMTWTLAAAD
jgi:hypothetical protein